MNFTRCFLLAAVLARPLFGGPPFLTDDPEPVDYQHWEAYLFANGDRADDTKVVNAPAAELNYGLAPETQLHLVVPLTNFTASGQPTHAGLGDTELGVKYRFVGESDQRPQIGVFPMAELPSGRASRGLGNGKAWYRLPVWLQKSFGPWTTYGGGGVGLNSAAGQRNYGFVGWLVQRDFGPHLTLGAEIFRQGPDTPDDRGFTAVNAGGYLNFTEHLSLLFSGGRSVAGDRHTLWYLALYSTWGPPEKSGR